SLGNTEWGCEWSTINEIVSCIESNPVEHNRCDDFVRTTPGLEKTSDATPECTCQYACQQHRWDKYPTWPRGECEANYVCRHRSHSQLAGSPNIEEACTKGNCY